MDTWTRWIHKINEYDSDDDYCDSDSGIKKNNKNKELEDENNKLKLELEELKKTGRYSKGCKREWLCIWT